MIQNFGHFFSSFKPNHNLELKTFCLKWPKRRSKASNIIPSTYQETTFLQKTIPMSKLKVSRNPIKLNKNVMKINISVASRISTHKKSKNPLKHSLKGNRCTIGLNKIIMTLCVPFNSQHIDFRE